MVFGLALTCVSICIECFNRTNSHGFNEHP